MSFHSLPIEIRVTIFECYLLTCKDVQLRTVCKEWKKLVDEEALKKLWKMLHQGFPQLNGSLKVIDFSALETTMKSLETTQDYLNAFLQVNQKIKKLLKKRLCLEVSHPFARYKKWVLSPDHILRLDNAKAEKDNLLNSAIEQEMRQSLKRFEKRFEVHRNLSLQIEDIKLREILDEYKRDREARLMPFLLIAFLFIKTCAFVKTVFSYCIACIRRWIFG